MKNIEEEELDMVASIFNLSTLEAETGVCFRAARGIDRVETLPPSKQQNKTKGRLHTDGVH